MIRDLILIDTSGWICFFSRRGHEKIKTVISILLDEDRVAVVGPILIELIQGARNQEEKENIKNYAVRLFGNSFQGMMNYTQTSSSHWATAPKKEMRHLGTLIT